MPCCPFPITRTLFLLKTELCAAFERAASAFLLQAATAPCRELRTWSALPAFGRVLCLARLPDLDDGNRVCRDFLQQDKRQLRLARLRHKQHKSCRRPLDRQAQWN